MQRLVVAVCRDRGCRLPRVRSGALALGLACCGWLAVAGGLWAAPVTAAQAAAAALGFLRAEGQPLRAQLGNSPGQTVAYTDAAGSASHYVVYFKPQGYVIVPADDAVEPILAFAAAGSYDPAAGNPLAALLTQDLAVRLARARASGLAAGGTPAADQQAAAAKWERLVSAGTPAAGSFASSVSDPRVDPLVQTQWNQLTAAGYACYNYYTPPNAAGNVDNYPSGCVATTMAQVMRYHQWPTAGIGQRSCTITVDGDDQTVTTRGGNGAGGAYAWADMPLVPASGTTLAERQAIGALCFDAGASVGMEYTYDYAATDTLLAASALTSVFSYTNARAAYNSGISIATAKLYTMLNPNLDAGYPVILGITGQPGGHAIVCDGYGYSSSTAYHHLNLGWEGQSDAWYALPTIDTDAGYLFSSVYKCVYNVYTSGSGEIISGRVVNGSGAALAGVTVTATRSGGGSYTATTNSRGIYALAKVPSASTYTVQASQTGYQSASRSVTLATSTNNTTTCGNAWMADLQLLTTPTLQWSSASQTANENAGSVTVTAQLSAAATQAVTVPFTVAGSATATTDYALGAAGELSIAVGQTSAALTVTLVDDSAVEPGETVILTLGTPTNATLGSTTVHTLTITDNDTAVLQWAAASQSAGEGAGTATVTAQLAAVSYQEVTVPFTVSGTATAAADYSLSPASSLTIPAGQTSASVTVTLVDDSAVEPGETVILTLGTPTNATLGTTTAHTLTITDNDTAVVQWAAASQSIGEGAGPATMTVQLAPVSYQAVTVPFTVSGTATQGADYTLSPASSLTIPAGQSTATVTVTPIDDTAYEGNETVVLTLGTPTGASLGTTTVLTGTIGDNDAQPNVEWLAASQGVGEAAGTATITARLSAQSYQAVTMPFTVSGTATATADYALSPASSLSIAAGQTLASVTVTLVNDSTVEPSETVILTIGTPSNASPGGTSVHTLTIVDDDVPSVQWSAASQSVNEGAGPATVTAQLSATAQQTVTVPFTVSGTATAGTDYSLSPASSLTIAAGQSNASVTVTLANDAFIDPNETVVLTLGTPAGANLGSATVHTLTIVDDDAPTVQWAAASQGAGEGDGEVTVVAQLSTVSAEAVTIPFTVTGTATAGTDYSLSPASTLSIPAGQTSASVTVTLVDDLLVDPGETVVLTLGLPTGANLGAVNVHTLTLVDDDPTTISTALWAMGDNAAGQLGVGDTSGRTMPALVVRNCRAAAGGGGHSLYLKLDNSLWAVGENWYGALGTGNTSDRSTPVRIATEVGSAAAGLRHSLFVKTDGSLWATGWNVFGALGTGDTTDRLSPVQVASGVAAAAAGNLHSLFVKTDGSLWAMGRNAVGQLGTGDTVDQPAPVQVVASGVAAVAAGTDFSLFMKTDGSLWGMGYNYHGTLGTGDTSDHATPVPIATGVAALAAGAGHALFLKTDGSLWGMGYNADGELGTGDGADRSSPVAIASDVAAIAAGYAHSLFAKTDGSLWGMGQNAYGELGTGDTAEHLTPVQVPGVGGLGVAAGAHHSLFVMPPPPVAWAAASQSVAENAGTATITVQPAWAWLSDIVVPFTVSGTAQAGTDYSLSAAGSLTIAAGQSATALTATLVDNQVRNVGKTLVLTLGTPTNATLGAPAVHTLTLTDNEPQPILTVRSTPAGIAIGGTPAGSTPYSQALSFSTPVSLVAPATVVSGGRTHDFVSWLEVSIQTLTPDGGRTLAFELTADTTVEAVYAARASLAVTLTPAAAATAGAQWSIDGGSTWQAGGSTLGDLLAGTYTLSFKPVSGYLTPAAQSVTLAAGQDGTAAGVYIACPPAVDFNGDGKADLVWQASAGNLELWYMDGTTKLGSSTLAPPARSDWRIVGCGDFDADGNTDLVVQASAGQAALYYGPLANPVRASYLCASATSWQAIAVADCNADGKPDLLWRSPDGAVLVWYLNEATLSSYAWIFNGSSTWQALAAGDLDGDGQPDLLWRSADGASYAAWYLEGVTLKSGVLLSLTVPGGYSLRTLLDVNGDGHLDLLGDDGNGQAKALLLDGNGNQTGTATVSGTAAPGVCLAAAGDIDNDGTPDLLAQNGHNVALTWQLAGGVLAGSSTLALPEVQTHAPVGCGDFNDDGLADVVWQDAAGKIGVYFGSSGAQPFSGGATLYDGSTTWRIKGVADLDNDGTPDLVWQGPDGHALVWYMGAGTLAASGVGWLYNGSTAWQIVGAGQLDGDANADLLWRNTSGETWAWYLDGSLGIGSVGQITAADDDTVFGVGDFAGSGQAGSLRRTAAGQLQYRQGAAAPVTLLASVPASGATALILPVSGGLGRLWLHEDLLGDFLQTYSTPAGTPAASGPAQALTAAASVAVDDRQVVSAADLNADGVADLVWQDGQGRAGIWTLSYAAGANAITADVAVNSAASAWKLTQARDFDGDGQPDLLWRGPQGHELYWPMNGTTPSGQYQWVYNGATSWLIVAAADLDYDGTADTVWQSTTGSTLTWFWANGALGSFNYFRPTATTERLATIGDFNGDGHPDYVWQAAGNGSVSVWFAQAGAPTGNTGTLAAGGNNGMRLAGP